MPSISVLLLNVYENVYGFNMKSNYSEPKIYTGGIDPKQWSKLSKADQRNALKKDWYLYYSFRDPKTGKLKRQSPIKGGANRFHNKRDRFGFLKVLQRNLLILLDAGFSPYSDNTELMDKFFNKKNDHNNQIVAKTTKTVISSPKNDKSSEEEQKEATKTVETATKEVTTSVAEAFELGLKIKRRTLNQNSYPKYKSTILRFQKWLNTKGIIQIEDVTKKAVVEYLNIVLENTSARSRNNARTNLSSLFTTLEDNEIIRENFIHKINVLKTVPERNKTFTPQQIVGINSYLDEHDPLLKLFIQFISYNFLRPIEVCRLKIGDIDVLDRKIYVRAKNKPVKIKIIPEILLAKLPDLVKMDKNSDLFTPYEIGGVWDTSETDKRNYFSGRFKKVKDNFGLGKNYGLYSFRHTHTTILYRELAKTSTPLEAKSKLMLITGHTTLKALEAYLRDIDAVLPQDYSHLFQEQQKG
ncbi:site-specific integrase [Maribacter algarum]|uniref:Site-specific integrase n=1 Tax=Maribacter algarum (ex Zhang et al. 2020) TaxID=2578118 RepID=A0A5S3PE08_9FLAO|nr:site-specific integrase [Maribacter algarum]TMM52175.1 site-specific integrase [Maribacter algarum]